MDVEQFWTAKTIKLTVYFGKKSNFICYDRAVDILGWFMTYIWVI